MVAGESGYPGGELGAWLEGVWLDGEPALLVGAPESFALGLDQGALYIARFPTR